MTSLEHAIEGTKPPKTVTASPSNPNKSKKLLSNMSSGRKLMKELKLSESRYRLNNIEGSPESIE